MTDDERRERVNFLVELNHKDVLQAMLDIRKYSALCREWDGEDDQPFPKEITDQFPKGATIIIDRYFGYNDFSRSGSRVLFYSNFDRDAMWLHGLIARHSHIDILRELVDPRHS